jgi:hypothetical protein
VALYGLTHIALDDTGIITTARVRGINPTMPLWMGKAVDMETSGVAALIKFNKIVAIFDITEDRPRAVGGTFRAVTVGGRLSLELSGQSQGQAMTDLPRIATATSTQ